MGSLGEDALSCLLHEVSEVAGKRLDEPPFEGGFDRPEDALLRLPDGQLLDRTEQK